jgi:protoheme IX farnesyltransferase
VVWTGIPYGLGAAAGGALFVWKSVALYLKPTKEAALANFFASLVQLMLLILGVVLNAALATWLSI